MIPVEDIVASAVESVADIVHDITANKVIYPDDHKAGMRVPKGGSSCAVCEYLKGSHECGNKYFIQWNGSSKFEPPADEYCCDFFEAVKGEIEAGGQGSGRHPTVFHGGKFTPSKAKEGKVLFTAFTRKAAQSYADESGGKVIVLRSPVTNPAGAKEVNDAAKQVGLGKE